MPITVTYTDAIAVLDLGDDENRFSLGALDDIEGLLDDVDALRGAYADVCVTLGRTVDVHLPGGDVRRGEALDIDATGALVVATDDGALTVAAGDVVHVRAAR